MMWRVDQYQVQTAETGQPVDCRRRMPTRQNGPHRCTTLLWTIVQLDIYGNKQMRT